MHVRTCKHAPAYTHVRTCNHAPAGDMPLAYITICHPLILSLTLPSFTPSLIHLSIIQLLCHPAVSHSFTFQSFCLLCLLYQSSIIMSCVYSSPYQIILHLSVIHWIIHSILVFKFKFSFQNTRLNFTDMNTGGCQTRVIA